jgi:hypothetical protein
LAALQGRHNTVAPPPNGGRSVIELDDGRWACRQGTEEFDRHGEIGDAVAHIRAVAAQHLPAELFVHGLDGSVRSVGVLD